MSLRLSVAICLIPAAAVLAQGIVYFKNNVTFQTPGDRLIRWPDGTGITGTNYVAQLCYGPSAEFLIAVTNPPARFRAHTTTVPGTWVGGNRTLWGFGPGSSVVLQVRFWDTRHGATFDEARASGGLAVSTLPFNYTVPQFGGSTLMENFHSAWALSCPFDIAPIIHVQPTNQTVRAGSNVTLRVVAEYPCDNQWYFNGGPLPNARASSLTVSNIQAANAGDYYVIVGNRGFVSRNATTSQVARVSLYGQPRLGALARIDNKLVFHVPGDGVAGQTFVIETAVDLTASAAWVPIFTNSAPFWFTNSSTAGDSQGFYRTVFR